jgi:signal transduction histidine kinase/ActR/RegA family two-component response regulator
VIGLRDRSIRHRLLLMSLASTAVALVLASGGFLTWDLWQFRSDLRQEIGAQARLLSESGGASLAFQDDEVGEEILDSLALRPRVEVACLYLPSGVTLASYERDPGGGCPSQPVAMSTFGWDTYEAVSPVRYEGDRVGTLYIRRELGDMYARLRVGALAVAGLLLLAIGAAVVISARMQRSFVNPLLQLANTARAISTTDNYGLRADPSSPDEIGVVTRAFNDMLDRMAASIARERDANRLKDEFLATLSHELRTPLNAVLGWTRMLRSGHLEREAQAKALATIERNAQTQAMLIEDLLDMSRIVSGRPRLQAREADLAAVMDAAVDVIRPAAAAKRLRLDVEIADRPALTYGDPGRLQQIAWNLLSNAVKFTPPDGQIWIRLERDEGYRLSVRDTGPGIDPGFLPLVFDRFRQQDGTPTREYGGLGLGLAIAKQLVELHGGTITAHSPGPGGGSTFEVFLPSVLSADTAQTRARPLDAFPSDIIDPTLLEGVRVLVVDDDEDARLLLDATLSQYGAEVTTAANVAEGLAAVDRCHPDVLLSDIAMPGEDGHTLIRKLRVRPPSEGGDIPAVAVSAYASIADGLAAESAGFQAHVAKPFDASEVVNLVALLGQGARRA